MYEKITEKEIEFCESFFDPVGLLENIFPVNLNAPSQWNEESETIKVRPYQFAMIGYDSLYAFDERKDEKANLQARKGAGDIYNISARNIGKTFFGLVGDSCTALLYYPGIETCLSSFDDKHLKEISEKVASMVEQHKLFAMLHITKGNKQTVGRQPHRITTAHGHLQIGVNEQIYGKKPGTDFHGKHYQRLEYDEASYMSKEGTEKRIDSGSSLGYIERFFGIPDIRLGSPLGDILRNPKNKPWICRLPQYVRDDWDENQKAKMVEQYGGEGSLAYKLNVIGEPIEGAEGKWDMERIKKASYIYDRRIKFFEISKELCNDLDKIDNLALRQKEFNSRVEKKVIVTRIPCKKCIVASDIGTTGSPSEVAIYFQDATGRWKYEYQISLFQMTVKEQAYFFNWLFEILEGCFISLDCTNADGRAIRDELMQMKIPQDNLSDFRMNQNIEVDFLKDDKGKLIRGKNGKPQLKEENTKEFGLQQLGNILYNGLIEIPHDEKFLKEFAGFFERKTGNRLSWGSTTTEHLHDTFILFALCVWENEYKNLQQKNKKRCLGFI
jgi:hypothetical protein